MNFHIHQRLKFSILFAESNFGWAAHQIHHSSEEFNLAVAFRSSSFQKCYEIFLYLPCAIVGVPLPAIVVHQQFNLLYQFWTHTEQISSLGPLELILNTPSHHRVHHGTLSLVKVPYATYGVLIEVLNFYRFFL